jgi:hypothetical protein
VSNLVKNVIWAAIILAISAQPANACWNDKAADALKIKHLNTMLMATALRCRNTPDDFLLHYNAFVEKHNDMLGAQNAIVRLELSKTLGNGGAVARSDNLSVGYANAYGAGHPTLNCRQLKSLAIDIADKTSDARNFSIIADRVLNPTDIPGAICKVEPSKIASK